MDRGAAKAGILLAASAIVLVTLIASHARPLAESDAISWSLSLRVVADALRNVVLFAPLGATLAWARSPPPNERF